MPAVLVHGVPETPALWDLMRPHLHRDDLIILQLPGFGCPRPDGFGATKEAYVEWLVAELEQIRTQGPIDLVGHDWGGGLTVRLVCIRPDLVRSWMTDFAGIAHPDFEWHDFAKIWQTPDAGEEFFAQTIAQSPEERGALYQALFAIPLDAAIALNRPIDQTMADCILALYRSATRVGIEWSPDFHDIAVPGCALVPIDDPFLAPDVARRGAQRAGAHIIEWTGLGHWWMLQDPARCATAIEEFWNGL